MATDPSRTRTSTKTLPTSSHLPPTALHPHLSLLALSTPPSSSPSLPAPPPPPTVTLYRISPPSLELVWTWSPPAPPVDPSAPAGTGGAAPQKKGLAAMRAAMLAKNRPGGAAAAGGGGGGGGATGTIEALRWSPDGQTLAVLLSPLSTSSSSTPPTLHLISLHTGLSLSPSPLSLPLPASSKSRLTSLSWISLPASVFPASSAAPTWAERLISSLPSLPPLASEGSSSTSAASSTPGLIGGGGGGGVGPGGGAGVFGAKQAMLERERAKEAQRALDLGRACPGGWPRLLSGTTTAGGEAEGGEEGGKEWTLLVVGTNEGQAHLFLSGSVFLGTVSLPSPSPSPILSTSILPSPLPSQLLLSLLAPSPSTNHPLSFPLAPSLPPLLALSTLLRRHVEYAFSSLQSARAEWEEARRVGKGWIQRVADVSRPHGVTTPPHTQLLNLLLTGRSSPSLLDFLSSKMNERGLMKWEQAMGSALERLRRVGWMRVVPSLERVVVGVMELEGWTRWPERASSHSLDASSRLSLLRALALAQETIAACARLQREVEEEERGFVHFGRWVRYELDKLAYAESLANAAASDSADNEEKRPVAHFAPLPVAHYIRNCLPKLTPTPSSTAAAAPAEKATARGEGTGSKILPFLNFGLATLPLDQNPDLAQARKWVEGVVPSLPSPSSSSSSAASREEARARLDKQMRRLKEELRGQAAEEELDRERERRASTSAGRGMGVDIPPVPSSLYAPPPPSSSTLPSSLPFGTAPPTPPHPSFSTSTAAGVDPDLDLAPSSASPLKSSPPSQPEPTQSIPAMLHLLASLLGEVLDKAVRASIEAEGGCEGQGVKVGEEEGQGRGELGDGETRVRAQGVWEVWVEKEVVRFTRPSPPTSSSSPATPSSVEHAAFSLSTPDAAKLRVVEFDFLPSAADEGEEGGERVVFAFEVIKERVPTTYNVSLLPLSSLPSSSFTRTPPSSTSSSALPPLPLSPSLTHPLRPQFPPSAISLSSTAGAAEGGRGGRGGQGEKTRVRVAMLGGEGRRVEVVEVEFEASATVGREGKGKGGEGGEGEGGGDVEMR